MQKPKVSVIMAVRNKKNIKDAVQSILDQTFRDFEFVIVEDGSDDGVTPQIVDEFAEKDERIRVIHNEKRMERCFSRNLAIEKSTGEYIAVNDGDDISLPDRLEKEVKYLDSHTNCYLICARAYLFDEDGKKIGESWGDGKEGDISEEIEKENRVVHSSVMFRNTKEYWYRDKFLYAQDYDLFLQMVADGRKIHILDDFLVRYKTQRDLKYDEYLVRQTYSAELARYILREKKKGKDIYEDIDMKNLEKYIPRKMIMDMNMKKHFFNGEFKEARNVLKEMMKEESNVNLKLYYADTFLKGNLHKVLKNIKRFILYR